MGKTLRLKRKNKKLNRYASMKSRKRK